MEESGEVEVLMERMKQLQECRDEEEASQEEMATRFEREKTESMLVATAGMCWHLLYVLILYSGVWPTSMWTLLWIITGYHRVITAARVIIYLL